MMHVVIGVYGGSKLYQIRKQYDNEKLINDKKMKIETLNLNFQP